MTIRSIYILSILFLLRITVLAQEGSRDYQYALIEAVKQKNIGNLPGAVELYKMVIKENDSVAVAHYELGTLYAVTGQKEPAIIHLKRANDLDPGNKWYFESYIDVLVENKDLKSAVKLLKSAIKNDPENVNYIFRLANVYFIEERGRKAIITLDGIEKEKGVSDRIILMKANIYERGGKYEKALNELNMILTLFPESVEFHVVAAELALKSKDKDLAASFYQEVFKLDSLNIYALTNLTDYYREEKNYEKSFYYLIKSFQSDEIDYQKKMAILSFYLSDEYFNINHLDRLEDLIRTMLEKYSERREIHLFATDFFIQYSKYNDALESLKPLLKIGEKKYELWKQGILLANAINQDSVMLEIATNAYDNFPDSVELIYFKGVAEFELENYEALIKTFSDENLSRLGEVEMTSQGRIMLAETYHKLQRFKSSDSLFRAIIVAEPDNYLVMNNFSYYLSLREESLDEAKKLSYICIENNPENGTFLDTYAWILFKLKQYEEAGEYIMKALKFGGDSDPDVNEHAAEINLALGSFKLAVAFFQKALLLGGDKERLIKKLEELHSQNEL